MNKRNLWLMLSLGCMLACQKENVASSDPCQATEISFSQHLYPLLQQKCLSCHSNLIHDGGVSLENYQAVVASAQVGELYDAVVEVNGLPPKMPKGGKLNACEVGIIEKWIKQGMKNN